MASKETVAEFSSILEDYFNIKICILGDNVSVKSVFDYILEELSKG